MTTTLDRKQTRKQTNANVVLVNLAGRALTRIWVPARQTFNKNYDVRASHLSLVTTANRNCTLFEVLEISPLFFAEKL